MTLAYRISHLTRTRRGKIHDIIQQPATYKYNVLLQSFQSTYSRPQLAQLRTFKPLEIPHRVLDRILQASTLDPENPLHPFRVVPYNVRSSFRRVRLTLERKSRVDFVRHVHYTKRCRSAL